MDTSALTDEMIRLECRIAETECGVLGDGTVAIDEVLRLGELYNGHEDLMQEIGEVCPMNNRDIALQGAVLDAIKQHDQFHPIHGAELCRQFDLAEAELRAIVNQLRRNCEGICSGPGGYWYGRSTAELNQTIDDLSGRVSSINKAIAGLRVCRRRLEREEDKNKPRLRSYDLFAVDECLDVVQ